MSFDPNQQYVLVNQRFGEVLAYKEGSELGIEMQKLTYNSNQLWRFVAGTDDHQGYFRIINIGKYLALDTDRTPRFIAAGSVEPTAFSSNNNFMWSLMDNGQNTFKIIFRESPKPRNLYSPIGLNEDGTNPRIDHPKENTQIWTVKPAGNNSKLPIYGDIDIELIVDQKYFTADGKYYLAFQSDGNLVVKTNNDDFIWGSYNNKGVDLGKAKSVIMQTDGNLCIYDHNNIWLWGTQTQVKGSTASINEKGELVILAPSSEIWNSSN